MEKPKSDNPKRDYPEDYDDDNGTYQNSCVYCGLLFFGNKRRIVCRVCDELNKKYD